MSKIIGAEKLEDLISDGNIIKNGSTECVDGIKYDFRLGPKFLKAYFGQTVDYNEFTTPEDRTKAVVEPGEVVFVLSKERLSLPNDIYIQLNPKRSLSQDGIELLGGLTVDPGYEGHLVFGLRNVAGRPYQLKPGTRIVGAHFFSLSEDEKIDVKNKPTTIDDFPQRLQDLIEKYEPVNPQNLAEELRELKSSFEDKQIQLSKDVAMLKEQVSDFSKELEREAVRRESETKQLNEKLQGVSNKLDSLSKDNIKHETQLETVQKSLDKIEEQTSILKNGVAISTGEKNIKNIIITAVITFVITVIGGIVVFYTTKH